MSRDPRGKFRKKIYFLLILHLILGEVTKFLVEKLSTSEVISQKPHGGWKHPPPPSAFRVKLQKIHLNFLLDFLFPSGSNRKSYSVSEVRFLAEKFDTI